MNSKKIVALIVSALMLATPVAATSISQVGNINDLVSVTDSTVSFPIFVIGSTASTSDVAGAVGAAVRMAAQAKTTSYVTVSGVAETVTGGVKVETAGNKLTPWETLGNVKNVLTGSDISMLADSTYTPVAGTAYAYKQYLYVGGESPTTACSATTCNAPHVEFSRPTGENAPRLSLKMPLNQNVTTYKLVFTTPVSLSTVTTTTTLKNAIVGTSISLMGKEFVISDATWDAANSRVADVTFLGGGTTVTVETGTDKTVTVGGKDYTIHLDSVASETVDSSTYYSAIGNINGEVFQKRSGQTFVLSDGTNVGVVKVFAPIVAGQAGFASFTIGGASYKIYRSATVLKGTQTITGLTSTLTATNATGWSSMTLTYAPNEDTFMSVGDTLADPFVGAYDIKFNSITPTLDSTTSRQSILYTPSGYNMIITYKNAAGNEETVYALYVNSTTVSSSNYIWGYSPITGTGSDNNFRDLVFDESHNISAIDSDYFIIEYGGFSHVLRFTSFDASNSQLTFTDETGSSLTVYNTSATAAQLIIDGNAYGVCIKDAANKKVLIDLNRDGDYAGNATGCASGNTAGVDYANLVPKLITSAQGGLYFYKGQSSAIANASSAFAAIGLVPFNLTMGASTGTLYVGSNAISSAGGIALNSVNNVTGTAYSGFLDTVVTCTGGAIANCTVALGTSSTGAITQPGFVLVEEPLEGTTTHNWVYFPINYSATYIRAIVGTPQSDDANFGTPESVIGTTGLYKDMDTYGTKVEYDTTAGSATLSYPDSFTYANVYVLGPDGTITSGGAAGEVTTDVVLPITADIVKLDSEITSTDKTGKDLILVGGPCVNTLVAELATAGKFPYTCAGWPGRNFGRVQVISGGFATGYTVAVITGTRAADTDLAARIVQTGFPGATASQKAGSYLEITGTVTSPAYST
jgi:hypothetical protein